MLLRQRDVRVGREESDRRLGVAVLAQQAVERAEPALAGPAFVAHTADRSTDHASWVPTIFWVAPCETGPARVEAASRAT